MLDMFNSMIRTRTLGLTWQQTIHLVHPKIGNTSKIRCHSLFTWSLPRWCSTLGHGTLTEASAVWPSTLSPGNGNEDVFAASTWVQKNNWNDQRPDGLPPLISRTFRTVFNDSHCSKHCVNVIFQNRNLHFCLSAFIYACLTPRTSDKDRSLTTSCSVSSHGRNLLEYRTCCYQNFQFVCQIKGGHKTKT